MDGLWMFPAMGALFVVGGVYFATSGARRGRQHRAFVNRAQVTTAEVIDLRMRRRNSSPTTEHRSEYWVPVVRFALPDGRWVESETMYGATPAPARTGDVVTVRFDPEEPTRVNLATGLAQGSTVSCLHVGLGVALALFGLLFVVGGLLVLKVAS